MDSSQLTKMRRAKVLYANILTQKDNFNSGNTIHIQHQKGGSDFQVMAHISHGSIYTTVDEYNVILPNNSVLINNSEPVVPEPVIVPEPVAEMVPEPAMVPEPTDIQGSVTTIAGNNMYGNINAIGTNATFQGPNGIAIDTNGIIYVADTLNSCIRKITPDGEVSCFAGNGIAGFADGPSTDAQFNRPESLALDKSGILYVIDTKNNRIRKIADGQVTTLAGDIQGYSDGEGTNAQFSFPGGIVVNTNGILYVADALNHKIRTVTPDSIVATFAGSVNGYSDGEGTNAQFSFPTGITIDSNNTIYVADRGNARIRSIDQNGNVTTLAGGALPNSELFVDGAGASAYFRTPSCITVDTRGTLYVTDTSNNIVRKVTSDGVVTTIAGKPIIREQLFADGVGTEVSFRSPYGISFDTTNNILYVADSGNNRIRKIV